MWRATHLGFVAWAVLGGCRFEPVPIAGDAPIDVPDAPIDVPRPDRVQSPAALWRFAEAAGTVLADSVTDDPEHLTVQTGSMLSLGDGSVSFAGRSAIDSEVQPHFNQDIRQSGAVTFEAWVTPDNATQGATSYAVIAGITATVLLRNIDLEQRGMFWAGRARTSGTTSNADPPIVGTVPVDLSKPTHLALVASASERVLYINGMPFMSTPSGGGTMNWDANYKLRLGDDGGGDRHWRGKLWLLAIYDRVLDADEIMQNFLAGHDCPEC